LLPWPPADVLRGDDGPKPCHAVAGCRCPRGIGRARTRATGGVPSIGSRSGLRRAPPTV